MSHLKICIAVTLLVTSCLHAQQSFVKHTDNNLEIIASISPPNPDPSGIAVTKTGRVFLGFPRHADNHKQFALAELVNGSLIPFPNKDYVFPSDKPFKDWLVSPHGMTIDSNGLLWILDDGKRSGIKEIPDGAAKVVAINVDTKQIVYSIPITKNAMSNDSHLNDLRVDLTHGAKGMVYIANSGFGERYSLVVVDIAKGTCREVLLNHPSVSPEPGFVGFLERKPLVYDPKKQRFPVGGADGIALSPDGKKVYWTAITGRKLYSLPADVLSNFETSDYEIEKAITFEGERPACDGLAEDTAGNIYFGSFEQLGLVKRKPDGSFETLVNDDRLGWPDGLFFSNGYL
jgi:sugar lactone lactonase YvrE